MNARFARVFHFSYFFEAKLLYAEGLPGIFEILNNYFLI
jgi:hypothetical protein